jgi:alpha-amylase/alpha-mannosidase (GH57 family)
MKTAHICFLWHMHQPYYTDPVSGTANMPWVRLHAIKAYFDMPLLLERFPAVRATFNLTPSLLLQLTELTSGTVKDLFLEHAQRPATELTPSERAFIIRHFFAANWGTMVRPFPRYHELLVKRGTKVGDQDLDRMARQFTSQELLDLQVWHNLAWFGYAAVSRFPRLQQLRRRDRGFSEEDKHEVLSIQQQVLQDVIPAYHRLAETGQIELTTTPFYHPILPLLIDTDSAQRARPDLSLPRRTQAVADAQAQLHHAIELHTELFGKPPVGVWPAEGSVCPEMMPLLSAAGARWFATDEAVLARSQRAGPDRWDRRRDLYRPYKVGGAGLTAVFRDRELSDALGFVYSRTTPESAVEDLLRRLGDIVQHAPNDELVIPIILDGENPWEHYHDGGEAFLAGLYSALSKGDLGSSVRTRVQARTVSEAIESHPRPGSIEHLHSGSWINADFKIWIGHPEDNRGWELLRDIRGRLQQHTAALPPAQARAAWEELYAAEGSDWFWWYGDDFETDYKAEFDRLFRTHLRNALTRAGLAVPETLNEPLFSVRDPDPVQMPVRLLSPTIDGLITDFFEWRGAGEIEPAPPLGAMWKASRLFQRISFGYSLDALYVLLEPGEDLPTDGRDLRAELSINGPAANGRLQKLTFLLHGEPDHFILSTAGPEGPYAEQGRYQTIKRRKVLELAMPFKDLGLEPEQQFRMSLAILKNGLELERYPRHAPLVLTRPDRDFETRLWRV